MIKYQNTPQEYKGRNDGPQRYGNHNEEKTDRQKEDGNEAHTKMISNTERKMISRTKMNMKSKT